MSEPDRALPPAPDDRDDLVITELVARVSEEGVPDETETDGESLTAVQTLQKAIGHDEHKVKGRLRAQALIALAAAGHSGPEIAKILGMKPNAVRVALYRARTSGQLDDLRDLLKHDLTANAIDTMRHAIVESKSEKAAIEHLKGTGYYMNHAHVKNDGGAGSMPPLQVNVIVQNGVPAPTPETFAVSDKSIGVGRIDT